MDDDDDVRCETMLKFVMHKQYSECVKHVLSGCLNCITNPKKKFGGREMLFPNGPPPWIEIEEEEKSNPQAWNKYKKVPKQKKTFISEEEIDNYLMELNYSEEKLVHEITKYKKISRQEAWKLCHQIKKKKAEMMRQEEKEKKNDEKRENAEKREKERLKRLDEKRKSEEMKVAKKEGKAEIQKALDDEEKAIEKLFEVNEKEMDEEVEKVEEVAKKKDTVFNLKSQMPWCPNKVDILCIDARSLLGQDQQRRISAMCQNLMYHGDFEHVSNKREYRDLVGSVENEYDEMVEAALEWAKRQTIFPLDFTEEKCIRTGLKQWQRRIPQNKNYLLSNILFSLDLSKNDEITVNSEEKAVLPKFVGILEKGLQDVLEIPDMRKKAEINRQFVGMLGQIKMPIEEDPNARHHLLSNPAISIMMDASTACHLMTPCWESRNYGISIPIRISEEIVDGKQRKIIILQKPIPSTNTTIATLQRMAVKRALKRQLVVQHAKNKNFNWKKAMRWMEYVNKEEKKKQTNSEETQQTPEEAQPSTSKESDPLDSIFADIDKMNSKTPMKNAENLKYTKIEAGYQYGLFQIGGNEVLIRSRPPYEIDSKKCDVGHGVFQMLNLKSVTFEPRVEYLPNAGAMELGVEEWTWNYLKKLFKNSKSHVLFRTHFKNDQILQADGFTMHENNKSARPQGALALLSSRTMHFESFLNQLQALDAGEYLAHQEMDKPMRVVPSCDSNVGVSSEALKIQDAQCEKLFNKSDLHYFYGFSPNVMFQWQIVQGRAPRMLLAKDSPVVEHLPKKGDLEMVRKRQGNLKRKFQQKEQQFRAKRPKAIDLDDPNLSIDFTNPSNLSAVPPPDCYESSPSSSSYSSPYQFGRGKRGRGRGSGRGRGRGRGRGVNN